MWNIRDIGNISVSYFRVVTAIYERNQLNLYVGVCVKESDETPLVILCKRFHK